jgi:hypothetical protein
MRRLLNPLKRERGSSLVEYAVVVAVMIMGLVPAVGFANDAVVTVLDASVAPYVDTSEGGSGDGGGGGGSTTTVPETTTTTVPPTTTTTTVPPTTTTTTVPPTTTTTTVPPNQVAAAEYEDEISVTFSETDGVVTYDDVEAEGWTFVVTEDSGTSIRMEFTTTNPDRTVNVRGYLSWTGNLRTRVTDW